MEQPEKNKQALSGPAVHCQTLPCLPIPSLIQPIPKRRPMPRDVQAPLGPGLAPQETLRADRDVHCSPSVTNIQGACCAGLRCKYKPEALLEQDFIIASGWENVLNEQRCFI